MLVRYLDKNGVTPRKSLQHPRYFLDLKIATTPHNALGGTLVLERVRNRIHAKFRKTKSWKIRFGG